MTGYVELPDRMDVADLTTFCARARRLDASAMRLQAAGQVLGVTVCTQEGHGLMGEGTVLALRAFALAQEADLDVVVSIESVQDRLARLTSAATAGAQHLAVPPVPVVEQWAAVAPPRGGWAPVATLDGSVVTQVAADGISEVAASRTSAVREVVWERPIPGSDVRSAAALAVHALGFTSPEITVFRQGRWRRLSTPAGHVLTR